MNKYDSKEIKEIKEIECLEEYIKIILKNFSNFKPNDFHEKKRAFFRGQNKKEYGLIPSLGRKIAKTKDETFVSFENKMIKTAKLQNPEEFNVDDYPINMLARMQHYGLPTRLLDVTENALVALYFSCKGKYDYDGKVFCFVEEQNKVHSAYSLYVNLLASLENFAEYTETTYKDFWEEVKYKKFVNETEFKKNTNLIEKYLHENCRDPIFVLPEMITEREKRQQSAFIIFPNKTISNIEEDLCFENKIKEFNMSGKSDKSYIEILVSAKKKKKILKQLNLFGISEQFLFPEIDKKCFAIKEQTIFLFDNE